jgi:8-oxo-dGTP pyrophosphatase MutT (NUDIX family)
VNGKTRPQVQYAALPYRRRSGQALEVLLITSRGTRRWVIPKGWPVENLAPHESAAHEAMEEAGVIGRISKRPIGSYRYKKRLSDGSPITCQVTVFPLNVEKKLPSWLEKDQRQTKWFEVHDAANAVQEPELRAVIQILNSLLAKR